MQERRWWLYCQDLEFAREKQWDMILNENKPNRQAEELAIMTYLGQHQRCEEAIVRLNLTDYKNGRDALCRARREFGASNTWESLANNHMAIHSTLEEIDKTIKNKNTVCIRLVGGIGDQLEASSLILGQINNSDTDAGLKLTIKACGSKNEIVNKFLQKSRANKIVENGINKRMEISYPLYRCWHEKKSKSKLIYEKLYDIEKREKKKEEQLKILACWRCKTCKENRLSSFSRSIPFQKVMDILGQIRHEIDSKKIRIIDITNYNKEEIAILRKNHPNICLEGENIKDIGYTAKLIAECHEVVSVDTSLVHIAATSNHKVHTLLPLNADERWNELMNTQSVYKSNVVIYKQIHFHDWKAPCRSLLRKITSDQSI